MKTEHAVKKGRRALVLGGGIAGLSAAIVLARHFDEVTLVERDRYSEDVTAVRPHTPQGAHAHVLLAGGLVALSRLIPHLAAWFDEMGVAEGDLTHHTRVAFEGRWLPKARSGIPIRVCTRSDVEHLLRRHLATLPNVTVRDGCKVEGLIGRERAGGARVSWGSESEELCADLVVDALGRGSPALRWLGEIGVSGVDEQVVDGGIVYASAWFDLPASIDDDWSVLAALPSIPNDARLGVIARFPSGKMICSLVEYGRPKAPANCDELVDRFGAVSVSEIYRLLRISKPISDVSLHGNTHNRLRRFGRLPSFPDGLVVLGDAVCCLNPRYGQGMTVAAMSAERLDHELSRHFSEHRTLDGFSRRFHRSLERMLIVPWQIALMEDRAWVASLSGQTPPLPQRAALFGAQRLLHAAMTNIDTYIRFMRVAQLLDSPAVMLEPRTIARIARGGGAQPAKDDAPSIGSA